MRPILPIRALVLAGCASRVHVPLATSYAPGADGTRATARGSALLDVTTIWPLPPLDSVAFPTGSRELRIADWYSMILGRPVPALRLVEDLRGARGEILHVWFEGRDWPRPYPSDFGFLLTALTIQLVPPLAEVVGWRWAFAVLALGPVLGIASIRRLVGVTRR